MLLPSMIISAVTYVPVVFSYMSNCRWTMPLWKKQIASRSSLAIALSNSCRGIATLLASGARIENHHKGYNPQIDCGCTAQGPHVSQYSLNPLVSSCQWPNPFTYKIWTTTHHLPNTSHLQSCPLDPHLLDHDLGWECGWWVGKFADDTIIVGVVESEDAITDYNWILVDCANKLRKYVEINQDTR